MYFKWRIKKCKQTNYVFTLKEKERRRNAKFFLSLNFKQTAISFSGNFIRLYITSFNFQSIICVLNSISGQCSLTFWIVWFRVFSLCSSLRLNGLFRVVSFCSLFFFSPFITFGCFGTPFSIVRSFVRVHMFLHSKHYVLFLISSSSCIFIADHRTKKSLQTVYGFLFFSLFLRLYVHKSLEDKCVSQPFILSLKLLKSSGPRSACRKNHTYARLFIWFSLPLFMCVFVSVFISVFRFLNVLLNFVSGAILCIFFLVTFFLSI